MNRRKRRGPGTAKTRITAPVITPGTVPVIRRQVSGPPRRPVLWWRRSAPGPATMLNNRLVGVTAGLGTPRTLTCTGSRDERLPARPVSPGPAHLGLGAVNAQLDVLGCRVGEQVLQGADPDAGPVGDGEAAGREQGPYLPHRRRDGGAVPWYSSANAACGSW